MSRMHKANLTNARRMILVKLSDGQTRAGFDVATRGQSLALLEESGYIRSTGSSDGLLFDEWFITPSGLQALEDTQ